MNLIQYELFASVAQTLNVSKTAQLFYITQPAVSHHIKTLEASLGVELVKRTKRGVYLTEAGQEFLPYVHEILETNNRAEARMKNIADGMISHIKIAMLSSAQKHVSDCLFKFSTENPDVQVEIDLLDGEDMLSALRKNNYDVYFALNKMTPVDSTYEELEIKKERMAIYMNTKFAGPDSEPDWDEIAKHPLISVPKSDISLHGKTIKIYKNHGIEPRLINTFNRAEAAILSVSAGLGVAVLPESLYYVYRWPNVICYPLDEADARSQISFIWDDGKVNDAAKRFVDIVISMFKK